MAIRVVIADDQEMVRTGFRMILESQPDIEVVADVVDGEAALAAVAEHRPDVLLLDIRMPKLDGLEVTHAAVRREGAARTSSSSPPSTSTSTSTRRSTAEHPASS